MPLGYFSDSTPLTPLRDPFNVLVDGINANETAITNAANIRQLHTYRWANSAARTAQTGMQSGDSGYQVDTGVNYRYNGSSWIAWSSEWITYSATLGFTPGTGATNLTRYRWVGAAVIELEYRFVLGTGLSMAAATFTTPFAVRTPIANEVYGAGFITNITTTSGPSVHRASGTSTTVVQILSNLSGTPAGITPTAPWTWAAGNALTGRLFLQT